MSALAHSPGSDDFPSSPAPSLPAPRPTVALSTPAPASDPLAFTRQWAESQLSVRAYLNSFLSDRSAIDDCIQEIALLAWKKGPLQEGPKAFLGFCLACAKRVAMGEVRKKYRSQLRLLSPEAMSMVADTVAAMEHEEAGSGPGRISALQGCLDSLEPEPRRLLELRYLSKDTGALQRESKASGRSMDALYKKLERLRSLLRDCVTRKSASLE